FSNTRLHNGGPHSGHPPPPCPQSPHRGGSRGQQDSTSLHAETGGVGFFVPGTGTQTFAHGTRQGTGQGRGGEAGGGAPGPTSCPAAAPSASQRAAAASGGPDVILVMSSPPWGIRNRRGSGSRSRGCRRWPLPRPNRGGSRRS